MCLCRLSVALDKANPGLLGPQLSSVDIEYSYSGCGLQMGAALCLLRGRAYGATENRNKSLHW